MPPTAEAAAVTDAYRRRLLSTANVTASAVARAWQQVELNVSRRRMAAQLTHFADVAASSAETGQLAAVQLSSGYVPAFAAAAGVDATIRPVEADVGAVVGVELAQAFDSAGASMLWQLGRGSGRAVAVASGEAAAIRTATTAVSQVAWETVTATVRHTRQAAGWQRVTSVRSCSFCAMLATRGAVYRKDTAGFRSHPHCTCSAEPVFRNVPERYRRAHVAPASAPPSDISMAAATLANADTRAWRGPAFERSFQAHRDALVREFGAGVDGRAIRPVQPPV